MALVDSEARPVEPWSGTGTRLNEYGPLKRLVLCAVGEVFRDQASIDANWMRQDFVEAPDLGAALGEYERFVERLEAAGAQLDFVPPDGSLGLSAIYAHDPSIVTKDGLLLCRMRNASRAPEPAAAGAFFRASGIPVIGAIEGKGLLEGGDFIWLDERSCAVAEGYRTNAEGIRQLKAHLGPEVQVDVVPLPHHKGPEGCLHLMSIISPLDENLALVYSPLMPVAFRNWLLDRGMKLVEVPDEEFEPTMGCNVLALAPRKCLVIDGNPVTRERLEAAGCEVIAYKGEEISIKGGGGPTCLTRPLLRG